MESLEAVMERAQVMVRNGSGKGINEVLPENLLNGDIGSNALAEALKLIGFAYYYQAKQSSNNQEKARKDFLNNALIKFNEAKLIIGQDKSRDERIYVAVQCGLCLIHWQRGDKTRALNKLNNELSLSDAPPETKPIILITAAILNRWTGDSDKIRESIIYCQEANSLAKENEDFFIAGMAAEILGDVHREIGCIEPACLTYRDAVNYYKIHQQRKNETMELRIARLQNKMRSLRPKGAS